MRRPTEYLVLKRAVFNRKKDDENFSGHDAVAVLRDSLNNAYAKVEDGPAKEIIDRSIFSIIDLCHKNNQRMSESGALEVLAAIGNMQPDVLDKMVKQRNHGRSE